MLNVKKLAALGIVLFVIGIAGAIYMKDSALTTVNETKDIKQETFNNINVTTDNAHVEIMATKENTSKVRLEGKQPAYNKHEFSVEVQRETLNINLKDKNMKLINIDFFQKPLHLYVYVPEKQYKRLSVDSKNGKISVTKLKASNAQISSDNGHMTLDQLKGSKLVTEINNGRTRANDIHVKDVWMDSDNGYIELKHAETSRTNVESNNGRIRLKDVTGEITGKTDNGRISMDINQIDRPMDLVSHNGNINITTKSKPKNALFDTEVHNGSATIYGKQKNTQIFGDGKNIIKLSTHNGKITVE